MRLAACGLELEASELAGGVSAASHRLAQSSGLSCCWMYCLMISSGAPPQDSTQ